MYYELPEDVCVLADVHSSEHQYEMQTIAMSCADCTVRKHARMHACMRGFVWKT
jgi:hypothetical protein